MSEQQPERLESWKEIGAYLQRDARTVRRWEKDEGLPIHRHGHKRGSSVYAYPSEIDSWRASRRVVQEPTPPKPLWRIPAFAATLLLCLIMVGNGVRPQAASAQSTETLENSFNPDSGRDWRLSPDGRYIVGVATGPQIRKPTLAIHDVVSGSDRSIALEGDGLLNSPCYTPDGKRILFGKRLPSGSKLPGGFPAFTGELRIVNADGTGERTLLKLNDYSFYEPGAVAPSGKLASIGLTASDGSWQIGLVALESGKFQMLKNLEWRDTYVGDFTPDGRWLVYSSQVDRSARTGAIYAIAADGSTEHALVPEPVTHTRPSFTADGSRVVYLSSFQGHNDLLSIRVSNGTAAASPEILKARIGATEKDTVPIGLSPDGSYFFIDSRHRSAIYLAELDSTWRLKGTPSQLSDSARHQLATDPKWSPDGKSLAYLSNGAEEVLVVRNMQSGEVRELATNATRLSLTGWGPDDHSLLVADPAAGLRTIDVETQRQTRLAASLEGVIAPMSSEGPLAPVASSDRHSAFYFVRGRASDANTVRLMQANLETGHTQELWREEMQGESTVASLATSPDGNALFFAAGTNPRSAKRGMISLVAADSGKAREVDWRHISATGSWAWTPDSKAILFSQYAQEGGDSIWVQPVNGDRLYPTGIRANSITKMDVAPNGQIAYQVGQQQNLFAVIHKVLPEEVGAARGQKKR